MIKSMTGYGNATADNERAYISVEVKSLNSKYFDLNIKVPKIFNDKELEIRNLLSEKLERGKISLSIEYSRKGEEIAETVVNKPLFKAYYKELLQLADELNAPKQEIFRLALQLPEVINTETQTENSDKEWESLQPVLQEAIKKCLDFRAQEGKTLEKGLLENIAQISSNLSEVEIQEPRRLEAIRERIKIQMNEWFNGEQIDRNRFEQELIYYIEKLDINEEKVRLRSHLDYFKEVIVSGQSQGKKLNFITQELGREINTIGSKANDSIIQRSVVAMKDELEKIKEQLSNIL